MSFLMNWMNTRKYIDGRRITVAFGSLLFITLASSSCGASKQSDLTPSVTESEAVEKVVAGIIEAANAGDIETVMSYFAEDAVAMPLNEMPVFGTRLIRPPDSAPVRSIAAHYLFDFGGNRCVGQLCVRAWLH